MKNKTPKPKHQTPTRKRKRAPKALTEGLSVGQWRLARWNKRNQIWMFCHTGEAMVVDEFRLEKALTRFWKREF